MANAPRPGHPLRKETAMFTHPDITSQLIRERQRQMLVAARQQQQLRRQHGRQTSKATGIAAAVIRRLAPVIAEPSL